MDGSNQLYWSDGPDLSQFEAKYTLTYMILFAIILGLIIMITIIGNILVIAAIMLERNLQSISNYLIISLAVADLLVAAIVMPFSAIQSISQNWWLGLILCDIFVIADVLLCTVSILHLICIALDRYWAVTRVDYIRQRSPNKIFLMIFLVWVISLIITIPSRFFYERFTNDFQFNNECMMYNNIYYGIFSTFGAFYLPMLFMCCIYVRIYQAAIARIRKTKFKKKQTTDHLPPGQNADSNAASPQPTIESERQVTSETDTKTTNNETPLLSSPMKSERSRESDGQDKNSRSFNGRKLRPLRDSLKKERGKNFFKNWKEKPKSLSSHDTNEDSNGELTKEENSKLSHILAQLKPTVFSVTVACTAAAQLSKERLEHQREKKAAITLAIITGVFMLCWIPFFILETVKSVRPSIVENIGVWAEIATWLGYINSLLNPVIYTIFSPDFRNAFRKIIFGRYQHARR